MKMSWRRAKSPGWAAFDLKQQQKLGLELETDNEPYPPISTAVTPLHSGQNLLKDNIFSVRDFSSVLLPSVNSPTLTVNNDIEKPLQVGNSSANRSNTVIEEINDVVQAYEKLKEIHCWADKSLIEDIMAAVNDIDKANTLLKTMVSFDSFGNNNEINVVDLECNSEDFFLDNNSLPANNGVSRGETTDLAELSCVLEDGLNFKNKELEDDHASCGEVLPDPGTHMKQILGTLKFLPVEPEWEEDDIYIIHRKDAMKIMRSASRLSKAANDAFQRGDHFSAKQLSLKARERWKSAERLNAKAAKEILSIRNCKNDLWKLDLHGLHAAEAVQALQEHLQIVESQGPFHCSSSPNRVNVKASILASASVNSLSGMNMPKLDTQHTASIRRPTSLKVVTGRGTHSRGQAALPTTIRGFLSENGYYYDEARPGVIMVRPKFRQSNE